MTKRYRCHHCGNTRLWVEITAMADLEQDDDNLQTFADGDHHWTHESAMGCHTCDTWGTAREFDTEKGEKE